MAKDKTAMAAIEITTPPPNPLLRACRFERDHEALGLAVQLFMGEPSFARLAFGLVSH